VIEAYQHAIDKLVAEKGYQSWDVISLRADNPQKEALRAKFLNEHTHGEDEVRFFVEGAGLFCLHIGDEVYQVLCEKNDLISVPAGTPHWFDMGSEPNFTAIRIFDNPEGWVAQFTGDAIADAYPRARAFLPLPVGEGRGEGKRYAALSHTPPADPAQSPTLRGSPSVHAVHGFPSSDGAQSPYSGFCPHPHLPAAGSPS
jgi:cupin superfamily acireductone dioxygenase involved in methionine salvage